jgi:hypothetical protein
LIKTKYTDFCHFTEFSNLISCDSNLLAEFWAHLKNPSQLCTSATYKGTYKVVPIMPQRPYGRVEADHPSFLN